MSAYTILYVGEYKKDEEKRFAACGVRTARVADPRDKTQSWAAAPIEGKAIIRAERLSAVEFRVLAEHARAAGVQLATSPQAFDVATDFQQQYQGLKEFTPRTEFLPTQASAAEVRDLIQRAGLRLPVFVRTELGSAAKQVGVDGCTVKDESIASVDRVLVGIRNHLAAAKQLILKEVVSIGSTSGGVGLEYRAVGVDGKFVAFDFDAVPGTLQPPSSFELDSFASKALASLAERGGSGALFLDVAVLTDGRTPTVVECKDFHYGTIANPEAIAAGLRRLELRS